VALEEIVGLSRRWRRSQEIVLLLRKLCGSPGDGAILRR
jgi:hypothetical protein